MAVDLIQRAIALRPNYAEAHNNLGNALRDNGQLDEAVAACRQAIALRPNYPKAHNNLGNALAEKGQLTEAIAAFRQAIALRPNYPEAYSNLGNALAEKGQLDEAVAAYRQAIALRPNYADAHNNLGNTLRDYGQLDEAVAACRQAIALRPNYPEAHNNLGNALAEKSQLDEAITAFRQAIALRPNYPEAHTNLGAALTDKGQLDEAIAAYRQAIALRPNYAEAHSNLGNTLKDMGCLDEAIAAYRQAVAVKPDYVAADSNLVYTLHFHPDYSARAIHHEHQRWNQQHAEPLRQSIQPHPNDRTPDRRLRIGYVSPDFRDHVVGHFMLPLLANHDHSRFEIFCYAHVRAPDAVTARLRELTDHWCSTIGLSDEQAAQLIRDDGIDILVDLTLHMAHNRLLVFARKPAPVQVTYLAYAGTSGLATMDCRLSDPYLDPPGIDESVYSEQTIRLAETYWCYEPQDTSPVGPLPASSASHTTFGCLNNFCKVTDPTLAIWARIFHAVPHSQLLLHAAEGSHRQRTAERLTQWGIDPARLRVVSKVPLSEYLQLYSQMDIALDPFPYGGGTTTCDALWMGVPVVSLAGNTAVSRAGLSILSNIGLPELVASTPDEYVQIATSLAQDLPRLTELRSTLRLRMQKSPLMDAPRFARNIEAAYRQMWQKWAGSQ